MAIQYIYPSGDDAAGQFYNESSLPSPLYSSVKEGVSTPNDADYNWVSFAYPTGATTAPSVYYMMDRPRVIPNDIAGSYMNIRCKTNGGGDQFKQFSCGYIAIDASGTQFRAYYNDSNFPFLISGNSFSNYTVPLQGLSHSGNVGRQFFPPFVSKLYLAPTTSSNVNSTLFISAVEIVLSGDNIFSPSNSCTLYTQGPIPFSGTLNNPTLYTSGPVAFSGALNNPTLYINGVVPTGLADGIPLFTLGKDFSSNHADLFIQSTTVTNRSDLFIAGSMPQSGTIPLVTVGGFPSGILNLSIAGAPKNLASGNLNLFTYSTLNSGLYNSIGLNITNAGYSSSIPLFVKADSTAPTNGMIPLFVKNDNKSNNFVPLVLQNNTISLANSVKLRTTGAGQQDGWNVGSASLPLYINRAHDGIYNSTSLFVSGPSGVYNQISMNISGANISTNAVNLSIPVAHGLVNSGATLTVHGF